MPKRTSSAAIAEWMKYVRFILSNPVLSVTAVKLPISNDDCDSFRFLENGLARPVNLLLKLALRHFETFLTNPVLPLLLRKIPVSA